MNEQDELQKRLEAAALLTDVCESADFILGDVRGIDLAGYRGDRRLRDSVERRFIIIIGEALRRLRDRQPDVAARLEASGDAIHFRNFLIHVTTSSTTSGSGTRCSRTSCRCVSRPASCSTS